MYERETHKPFYERNTLLNLVYWPTGSKVNQGFQQ